MTNVSAKGVEERKTHIFWFNNFFILKSYHLRNNLEKYVEPDRQQMTIWRKRVAY
jgi:hypothetical protein